MLDIAAIDQRAGEGPTDVLGRSAQEKREAWDGVGEDVSLGVLDDHGQEDSFSDVFGLDVLHQDGLAGFCDVSVCGKDHVFVEEGEEGMQEASEHELVDVLVELVGEELVESQTRSRLVSVHPSVRLLGLVPESSSDLGSDPLQSIIVLNHESYEPPDRINRLDWFGRPRQTTL